MGKTMTARQVVRKIEELAGYHVRTRGSRATYAAGLVDEHGRVVTSARAQIPCTVGMWLPGRCGRSNGSSPQFLAKGGS